MLLTPPLYRDLVVRHGLSVIAKGGDLVLTPDGDIAVTKDGDLQNGSSAHNAMFRLTEAWRLNGPAMRLMFEAVRELRDQHDSFEDQIERALNTVGLSGPGIFQADLSEYHLANDALGAATLGRGALAGSLMIVTASLLERFRADIEPTSQEWAATAPFHGGYSVGQCVIAAANSFRHIDEWRRSLVAGVFTRQQSNSITVLTGALGLDGPVDLFGDINASERIALLLGERDFERFEGAVLRYGNAVAAQVEVRSPRPL